MATTKFYVPELGDTITLAEDFTFNLHAEGRNRDLAAAFGHYVVHSRVNIFIDETVLPPMREPDYEVKWPNTDDYKDFLGRLDGNKYAKASQAAVDACTEYKKYFDDLEIHREESAKIGKSSIQVTLPKGTELIVDRIYIRKGASDYSSITFRTNSLGSFDVPNSSYRKSKTKKSLRFWVKLQECNTIVFES
jgi:hypothetical protein